MDESGDTERDRVASQGTMPTWVVFVVAALVWPVFLEVLILVPGMVLTLADGVLARASAVVIPVIVFLVSAWIGRAAQRAHAPRKLWVVPAGWAVIAAAFSLFGYFLSDTRDLLGAIGVLGAFVLGAAGFWLGIRS
jgi:hypothetical protein